MAPNGYLVYYYSTTSDRSKKFFDSKAEAIMWADAHVDRDPEVMEVVSVYKPDPKTIVQTEALRVVRGVLESWIAGQKSNHDANDHRGERVGDECWNMFHVDDIRRMIEDARIELGASND
jgi:hypothetical protein